MGIKWVTDVKEREDTPSAGYLIYSRWQPTNSSRKSAQTWVADVVGSVMRKFAAAHSYLRYLENYRKTNSNLFSVDDQEFKYSTLYIADSLYTSTPCTHRRCVTSTFI